VSAVALAARSAVRRRRLQTFIVAVVVLLSTATGVLAVGLLVVSDAPFDTAFARADGAHVTATFKPDVSGLAATASASGVQAAAGPFDQVTVGLTGPNGQHLKNRATLVGRSTQDGPVDRLSLDAGSWLTGPGQIVLARDYAGPFAGLVGSMLTVADPNAPASSTQPTLKLVGIADSVTGSAQGWVWPTQSDVLDANPGDAAQQMLYRFADSATPEGLSTELTRITANLPAGALLGATTYLTVRSQADRGIAPFVPFVVAFAVLGLVLSVLIIATVVNGAVVSGTRAIGVLKTVGFTPGQVVVAYMGQILLPAVIGCLGGAALGVALTIPVLGQTERAYNLPASVGGLPAWVIGVVVIGALAVVAVAAFIPATRAGRLAANQAITLGRAPRAGGGFRVRRALAATRLPRPLAFGLSLPLARPARSVGTVVAVLLGAVTLVFAVGLSASLHRVHAAFTRVDAVPVNVDPPPPDLGKVAGISGMDPDAVLSTVVSFPGTAHVVGVTSVPLRVVGVNSDITVVAYSGPADWTGYPMITGRWYSSPDEVVASSMTLRQTGHHVGDRLTLIGDSGRRTVTVVGEVFDGDDRMPLLADAATLAGVAATTAPDYFEVGLQPGTSVAAYVNSLQQQFDQSTGVYVDDRTQGNDERTFIVLDGLIATLALLLCVVAALGVLNTVVLTTRERAHETAILTSIGMTPGQVQLMIISSVAAVGIVAGVLAVPAGVALQQRILPLMGAAANTGIPRSIVDVYGSAELILLGLTGVAIAVIGALLPATWAARSQAARALRAE
jgi:putative ABC transport system permease protein